jgi:magnesium transporter
MLKKIYKSLGHELETVNDALDLAETQTFKGNERNMVIELSHIARDLLLIKRATALHGEVLESFRGAANRLFGDNFDFYVRDIIGEYAKISGQLRGQTEFLKELRSTNDSLLSTKQNEVMRTLTAINAVILPCALIAAIFTIPAKSVPLIDDAYGFALIGMSMVIVGIASYIFFKKKKWL